MVDRLGDVAKALNRAPAEQLSDLYAALRLQLVFEPSKQVVDVTIQPAVRVNSVCPRGDLNSHNRAYIEMLPGTLKFL
jgi:hypothetical protein